MKQAGVDAAAKLYTHEILALATELADYPLDGRFVYRSTVQSRSCGSQLEVGLNVDDSGSIYAMGLSVSACAIGQASAAIFGRAALGKSRDAICAAAASLEQWLADGTTRPDWPFIDLLDEARRYPGRHGAIMLPWRGAMAALPKDVQAG